MVNYTRKELKNMSIDKLQQLNKEVDVSYSEGQLRKMSVNQLKDINNRDFTTKDKVLFKH